MKPLLNIPEIPNKHAVSLANHDLHHSPTFARGEGLMQKEPQHFFYPSGDGEALIKKYVAVHGLLVLSPIATQFHFFSSKTSANIIMA